ncbi:Calcineurin-like phosphoesterase [Pustulibacterium marinum]|uniref:Calcineurin-like phosphoesterase n=1 Tax=Pustulibacterium marinum TaxID=1224947 RepID=A0A1I7G0P4_9FLAO|nr:Calcineurin-like phosphoesterase [Pustulibacterium marinum]
MTLYSCFLSNTRAQETQIAFLADVHLQDLYGDLSDSDYQGVLNPATGKYTYLRTMASQLHSTRIFNENYFAFLAALDAIAARNIKLVALPGDYTDDGQPLHVRGLARILHQYEKEYGMQFFITTGNHDPVGPFLQDSGKRDFLGSEGKAQPIFSKAGMYTASEDEHAVVLSKDLAKMGYDGILNELKDFGFFPKRSDLYWATPFNTFSYESYSYKKGMKAAQLANRTYEVTEGFTVPDVSYVVEPVEGLWLMAIDGDVYLPKDASGNPTDPTNYHGASLGYNNVLRNKQHLITWAKQIADEAKQRHKTLIAFSHFPMVDFNDDATPILKELLGTNKWQLQRVPDEAVAKAFAEAGIQIHVAGHMHINDTGVRTTESGETLVNIQTPSLAAYRPGFKILTINNSNQVQIETVTIDSVPHFKELFPLYETEYQHLQATNHPHIWNKEVLQAQTYHDFMLWHLKELVRLRFLNDWPEPIKSFLLENSLQQLAVQADVQLSDNAANHTGYDVLLDFYKLRNADVLALDDIDPQALQYYKQLIQAYKILAPQTELQTQLQQFFISLDAFLQGAPAKNFTVDLETGKISGNE